MKASFAAVVVCLLVLVSVTESKPAEQVQEKSNFDFDVFQPAVADHGTRQKRVTCDLLSFSSKWITVNDSACAAHCLVLFRGFKGGHCENGVCVCRR